jgi:DNA-binding NtrC family response regulator
MREDILIVLNEREPAKMEKAQELETVCRERSWCAQRLPAEENLSRVILERNPRVLVLDYLLGDITTALDLLQTLENEQSEIAVVLWTDEPSLYVAVTSMKLGAEDFIEIDSANSIERVINTIEGCLEEQSKQLSRSIQQFNELPSEQSLVMQAKNSRQALARMHSLIEKKASAIILHGPLGSGRSTLARVIHGQRHNRGSLIEIDCDTSCRSPEQIFGRDDSAFSISLLSHGSTLVIEHAEVDTGPLLTSASKRFKNQTDNSAGSSNLLIIGTSSLDSARAWASVLDSEIISLPSFAERKEDILPLIQRFQAEISKVSSKPWLVPISPQLLECILELEWPGNIRQLKAAIFEACTSSEKDYKEIFPDFETLGKSLQLEASEYLYLRCIEQAKDSWSNSRFPEAHAPSLLTAQKTVSNAKGDLRIAAAILGTTVPMILQSLTNGAKEIQ